MPHYSRHWLPAFVVPVVVIAAVIAVPLQAGAAVDLPDKTPEQVLLLVNDSTVSAFSGTLAQTSELGLPQINLGAGMGAEDTGAMTTALELLSGSHEARIYVGGETASRVQIKDHLAERDLVHNGDDVWLYDSSTNDATHLTLPADLAAAADASADELSAHLPTDVSTPAQLAELVLSDLDPSTAVSVGTDARVAGRSVYQLVLTPKTTDTLVASVSISVDSETGLPLQVSVLAQGQNAPAFQIGFTTIDLTAPNAGLFDFTPPVSATVTEQAIPASPDSMAGDHAPMQGELPRVTGTGWSSIVEVPASTVSAELTDNPMIDQLTTAVDGGRSLTTSLLTVFLCDDGRVFAGAVPLAALQAAAE